VKDDVRAVRLIDYMGCRLSPVSSSTGGHGCGYMFGLDHVAKILGEAVLALHRPSCGGLQDAFALHRRHRLVGQMLHEYAAALSATRLPNRGRRLTNVRKILDTTASLISRPAEKLIYLMSAGPRQVWVWGS
jgi:hypothetical protein